MWSGWEKYPRRHYWREWGYLPNMTKGRGMMVVFKCHQGAQGQIGTLKQGRRLPWALKPRGVCTAWGSTLQQSCPVLEQADLEDGELPAIKSSKAEFGLGAWTMWAPSFNVDKFLFIGKIVLNCLYQAKWENSHDDRISQCSGISSLLFYIYHILKPVKQAPCYHMLPGKCSVYTWGGLAERPGEGMALKTLVLGCHCQDFTQSPDQQTEGFLLLRYGQSTATEKLSPIQKSSLAFIGFHGCGLVQTQTLGLTLWI